MRVRPSIGADVFAEERESSSQSNHSLLLEARDLRKGYRERVALAGVSLEARRGEVVACIGPNGAGKTTLLTILAGIKDPDAGSVRRPAGAIGWVPQQPA